MPEPCISYFFLTVVIAVFCFFAGFWVRIPSAFLFRWINSRSSVAEYLREVETKYSVNSKIQSDGSMMVWREKGEAVTDEYCFFTFRSLRKRYPLSRKK